MKSILTPEDRATLEWLARDLRLCDMPDHAVRVQTLLANAEITGPNPEVTAKPVGHIEERLRREAAFNHQAATEGLSMGGSL